MPRSWCSSAARRAIAAPGRVPSEPLAIHDANGRPLDRLEATHVERDDRDGWVGYRAVVAPGTYRLRTARTHRNLFITIPPGRAAQVFVTDDGAVRLDDARVFLPPEGRPFRPEEQVGKALEATLEALASPRGVLPASVYEVVELSDDLCLQLAAAHVMLREPGPGLDRLLTSLAPYAMPDVAILLHACRGTPLHLTEPPLLRASFLLAMEGDAVPIAEHSAIAESARAPFHDSVWWTCSHRAWDARWIEPTVDALARRGTRDLGSIRADDSRCRGPSSRRRSRTSTRRSRTSTECRRSTWPEIPGYKVDRLLGRGSQGSVFRAIRDHDGVPVAIKVLPFAHNPEVQGEIAAMQKLDHPRLVAMRTSGMFPDRSAAWLELELCEGSVLDRLARLGAPMSVDEAWRVICDAIEGLVYLHDNRFVHRDIKPANLLLRADGSAALADFGLGPPILHLALRRAEAPRWHRSVRAARAARRRDGGHRRVRRMVDRGDAVLHAHARSAA